MKALSVAVLLALVVQPACDKGSKSAKSDPSSTATSGSAGAPVIKLLDAGSGEKRQLRFTAEKGLAKTLGMTMGMTMSLDLGGQEMKQKIPVIEMALDLVVTDVAPSGDIRYEFKLVEPTVVDDGSTPPQMVEAIRGAMAGMAGMSGSAVVTNRGFTKEADIQAPPGMNPQLSQFLDSFKQSVRQMSAPVPEEAVGVGAKWETTTTLTQNGMTLTQVATSELVSFENNVMSLKITMAQSAPKQKITSNGMTVDLVHYKGNGTGETTLDLAAVVPSSARVDLTSDMEMKAGGQTTKMVLDVAMTMGTR
jgi:hypothetical protein